MKTPARIVVMIALAIPSFAGCGTGDEQKNDKGQGADHEQRADQVLRTDKEHAARDAGLQDSKTIAIGYYEAKLESPGGDLRFGISLKATNDDNVEPGFRASIHNGPERIPVPEVQISDDQLTLSFPHYDSEIKASWTAGQLVGKWRKRAGDDKWTEMNFVAKPTGEPDAASELEGLAPFLGRWGVQFSESTDPAIGIFQADAERGFAGTFLTTVGDYRYLSGWTTDGTLWMSCFDGAHAFLFRAERADDGTLAGEFWSRDSWHELWTAQPDDEAALSDGFSLTTWDSDVAMSALEYPDLDGNLRRLDDPEFTGSVRLLHIFGSWCPNCHDAGDFLSELNQRYQDSGLKIQGLAFELTDDFERNAEQVRRYLARHEMDYPVLLVGPADKSKASERFPLVDRVRSYPTTIFLDRNNQVRAIHTGFSGPATGATHSALKARFEEIINELLAEASPS